jgi:DNA-binding MarR family transcriptional regulator
MRRVRREDETFGLSAPRMSALSCVVFGGPRTLGELAAMEQVSAPTMTRLVLGLERDGFVTRQTAADDRRVVRVSPTRKGKQLLESGRSRRVEFLALKLADLSSDEVETLSRASDIMIRMYEESR